MKFKVSIVGNCQANSWGKALEALQPDIEISHCEFAGSDFQITKKREEIFKNSDLLLVVDPEMPSLKEPNFLDFLTTINSIRVPSIICSVFHPDNGYLFSQGRLVKNGIKGDWNSRLLSLAYKSNASFEEFLESYNSLTVLQQMGYFDLWDDFINHSTTVFDSATLDFESWLSQVRRFGIFMHGINHPQIHAVTFLAEQVLEKNQIKYFPAASVLKSMADPLNTNVWPVSKVVADYYGVQESNYVVVDGRKINEIEFFQHTWKKWEQDGEVRSDLSIWPPLSDNSIYGGI